MVAEPNFHGLLIAGGAGTRLWPLSRTTVPKQLLQVDGAKHSLLQSAFWRLNRSIATRHIHTVTSALYDTAVLGQLRDMAADYPEANLLAEPIGRDSAPAVLWGALRVYHQDRDAVVAVLWSDHYIRNEAAFDEALQRAYRGVADGGIVLVGIKPNRPATTLGYVRYGAEISEGVFEVERFIEKPDLVTAERLLAEGHCAWNAGILVAHVQTLLEEYERLAPWLVAYFREHAEHLEANDWSDPELMKRIYGRMEKESLDYLVLEKTDRLRLIPSDLDWSDLGAWDELHFRMMKDDDGNAVFGNTVTVDTQNSYIRAGKRLVATVGVDDLVVVDTDDALLVCSMDRAQDVKRLVDELRDRQQPQVDGFEETTRPWGGYSVLNEGDTYKVKVLEVKPHQKLSMQMHHHRAEHWVVVQGEVLLTRDEEVKRLGANEYFYIPQGARHRIENDSDQIARIIEVQHGSYLGEDDIVRFDDAYGRS